MAPKAPGSLAFSEAPTTAAGMSMDPSQWLAWLGLPPPPPVDANVPASLDPPAHPHAGNPASTMTPARLRNFMAAKRAEYLISVPKTPPFPPRPVVRDTMFVTSPMFVLSPMLMTPKTPEGGDALPLTPPETTFAPSTPDSSESHASPTPPSTSDSSDSELPESKRARTI